MQVVEDESSESEPESPGIDPLVFSRDDFDTGMCTCTCTYMYIYMYVHHRVCTVHVIHPLPVAPAQLMTPGIGRNASCALGDFHF